MDTSVAAEVLLDADGTEKELLRLRKLHPRVIIQVLGMKRLPSAQAVMMIAAQTLRARDTDSLLASKPEVDLLLRLAGTSQIALALKESGYRSGKTKVLVAVGDEPDIEGLRKKELSARSSYRPLKKGELDEEDLIMVETAALLGTRT
jgi:tRNA threonylcarbamoyladenosine modification (KEOPS) complex Cgi121 subunit